MFSDGKEHEADPLVFVWLNPMRTIAIKKLEGGFHVEVDGLVLVVSLEGAKLHCSVILSKIPQQTSIKIAHGFAN